MGTIKSVSVVIQPAERKPFRGLTNKTGPRANTLSRGASRLFLLVHVAVSVRGSRCPVCVARESCVYGPLVVRLYTGGGGTPRAPPGGSTH